MQTLVCVLLSECNILYRYLSNIYKQLKNMENSQAYFNFQEQ